MKKKKDLKKLTFEKFTVAILNNMEKINGGDPNGGGGLTLTKTTSLKCWK